MSKPERIGAALAAFGPIDVLVNNAVIGLFGAFEAAPMATVREVFETNTFGVMAMTLAPMPMVAVYTASKMAIEGFTASLALELEDFEVRVKLVDRATGRRPALRATPDRAWKG